MTAETSPRADAIADAGILLIARDGVRALTHRAVDREAGIPQGSTSYYAPTRRALLERIVERLAARSLADADATGARTALPDSDGDLAALAAIVDGLVARLAKRADDMRARYALLLELDRDDPLHTALSTGSEVQRRALASLRDALTATGVARPRHHAVELMRLADALVFQCVAFGVRPPEGVVETYLRGAVRA